MSFQFLPLYTGDYLRDTRHLSPLKHGVYLLLLTHCWDSRGPVPLDEQEAAGIANCRSSDEIEALRYILTRFFIKMEDGFYNKRMTEILVQQEMLSRKRSDAGRAGGLIKQRNAVRKANAKQLPSNCQAIGKQVLGTPNLNLNPIIQNQEPLDTEFNTRNSVPIETCVEPEKKPAHRSSKIALTPGFHWEGITSAQTDLWSRAYPALDLRSELAKAAAWIQANPANRKSNYDRFLTNWFSRAQDRARPTHGSNNARPQRYDPAAATIAEIKAREQREREMGGTPTDPFSDDLPRRLR